MTGRCAVEQATLRADGECSLLHPSTVDHEVLEGGEECGGKEGWKSFFNIDRS